MGLNWLKGVTADRMGSRTNVGMLLFNFFKTIVLLWKRQRKETKNGRFYKVLVSVAFVNVDPTLTIVNDDPLLTIVNEEKRREETHLKGIGTYYLEVLKKITRSFSFPHILLPACKTTFDKVAYLSMTIFFRKRSFI